MDFYLAWFAFTKRKNTIFIVKGKVLPSAFEMI